MKFHYIFTRKKNPRWCLHFECTLHNINRHGAIWIFIWFDRSTINMWLTHGTFSRFTQFLFFFPRFVFEIQIYFKECKYFRLFPFANRMNGGVNDGWGEHFCIQKHCRNHKLYSRKLAHWKNYYANEMTLIDITVNRIWKKIHSSFLIPSFELIISHIRHHLIRNTISICCCFRNVLLTTIYFLRDLLCDAST